MSEFLRVLRSAIDEELEEKEALEKELEDVKAISGHDLHALLAQAVALKEACYVNGSWIGYTNLNNSQIGNLVMNVCSWARACEAKRKKKEEER